MPGSEQFAELLNGELCVLQNMGQRGSFDWAMCRYYDFERLRSSAFLQPNVAPALPHHNPAISLQRSNYFVVVENRDLGHTAISTTSTSLVRTASSSTGSRYN